MENVEKRYDNKGILAAKKYWENFPQVLHKADFIHIFAWKSESAKFFPPTFPIPIHKFLAAFSTGLSTEKELSIDLLPQGSDLFAQGEVQLEVALNFPNAVHNSGMIFDTYFAGDLRGRHR